MFTFDRGGTDLGIFICLYLRWCLVILFFNIMIIVYDRGGVFIACYKNVSAIFVKERI